LLLHGLRGRFAQPRVHAGLAKPATGPSPRASWSRRPTGTWRCGYCAPTSTPTTARSPASAPAISRRWEAVFVQALRLWKQGRVGCTYSISGGGWVLVEESPSRSCRWTVGGDLGGVASGRQDGVSRAVAGKGRDGDDARCSDGRRRGGCGRAGGGPGLGAGRGTRGGSCRPALEGAFAVGARKGARITLTPSLAKIASRARAQSLRRGRGSGSARRQCLDREEVAGECRRGVPAQKRAPNRPGVLRRWRQPALVSSFRTAVAETAMPNSPQLATLRW
jgi:hypothetical protein